MGHSTEPKASEAETSAVAVPLALPNGKDDLLASMFDGAVNDDPSSPLGWPMRLKIAVLLQVSLLAALGGLNTAAINPALVPLSKEFHITNVKASYQTTVCIALNGIAPFIWVPLANTYGRRPVYLFTTLLGFGSILACAYTKNYGQLLAARVFNGFFPAAFALGAATVVDLFPAHQRGRAMGVFTVTMTNGSHLAPIVGGLLGYYCGWRWLMFIQGIFKFAAICDGVMLVIIYFFLPETMHFPLPSLLSSLSVSNSRDSNRKDTLRPTHYLNPANLIAHPRPHGLKPSQFFFSTMTMAKHPNVLFPALYYAAQYGFASILPAVTVAHIFTQFFHWNTLDIGLAYGAALTIGGSLGELAGGLVLDMIIKREKRKISIGGVVNPEARLKAVWTGEILVPAGLLIYGFTLSHHTFWLAPLLGMATACFGIQVIATTMYTYSVESHPRSRSADVAQLFNFVRQTVGFTFAFYAVDFGERVGFGWEFLFFAGLGSGVAFLPVAWLMRRGGGKRRGGVGENGRG